MSKIERLIKEKCPNGVEYKQIKDVFTLFSGMRGVSSKWADNGNCRFIDYTNAYNNNKIDITKLPFATVKCLNQNTLRQGDILLTSASEIPDECAISSVIEDNINDGIFMDDHLFGLRLNDEYINIVNPIFINYYLSSKNFRENLYKAVRGVTRFYISNNDFVKLKIPIPPIEIQEEIAKILDKFIELEKELEKELEVRKKQYIFWYKKIFEFYNKPNYSLIDVCDYVDYRGKTPKKVDNGIFLVTAKNIKMGYIDYECSKEYISTDNYDNVMKRGKPKLGDVLFTTEAPCGHVAQVDNDTIALAQRVIKYNSKNTNFLTNDYLKYVLLSPQFQNKLLKSTNGGTVKGIKGSTLHKMKIPIPSLQEQERIVKILDKFDKLINDISEGIPAEIEARKKQYEYYRNKLLSFEELKTND